MKFLSSFEDHREWKWLGESRQCHSKFVKVLKRACTPGEIAAENWVQPTGLFSKWKSFLRAEGILGPLETKINLICTEIFISHRAVNIHKLLLCVLDRASSWYFNKGRPTWWHLLHYVNLLLDMFRMLIHPSSGACDYLVRYCIGCIVLTWGVLLLCSGIGCWWCGIRVQAKPLHKLRLGCENRSVNAV